MSVPSIIFLCAVSPPGPQGEGMYSFHIPSRLPAGSRQDAKVGEQNGKQESTLCNMVHQPSFPRVTQSVGITHICFPKPGWAFTEFVSPNR